QRGGEFWGEFVVVVVPSRGGLGGVWPGDAPDVLDESVLERDWGGEEQRVQGRAVESLADERAGADDQQGPGFGGVVGELLRDLAALARLHLAAQYNDWHAGVAESFGDCVEVIDPCGEYKDVGAVGVSGDDVGDELLEPGFIGDQGSVDLGHSAWRTGIGLPGVAELGGMHVWEGVRCEQVGTCRGELARGRAFEGDVM